MSEKLKLFVSQLHLPLSSMTQHDTFRNTLTKWYLANHRMLPWRQTSDPYAIWVSEIILQQTRVNQGIDYYQRFIARFPDIQTLASASEELVLKIWEGLGYYSRARNMHATARFLVNNHSGRFPQDLKELEKLKGIGKYTAAAIASIAYNKHAAVVDGNVLRFIARLFGIEESIGSAFTIKEISRIANELLNPEAPGLFNQALMEFGALQCIPANPNCTVCPFANDCVAFKTGKVAILPIKAKKAKVSERFFNYLLVKHRHNGLPCILLKRRNQADIWKHLYDFPLIETNKLLSVKQLEQHAEFRALFNGFNPAIEVYKASYRHLLTHRIIHARFFKVSMREEVPFNFFVGFNCVNDIRQYPLPKLINNFIADQGLNHDCFCSKSTLNSLSIA